MADPDRDRKRVIDTEEPEPVPLEIPPEHVAFIILKARAVEAHLPPVEPEEEPEAGTPPPEEETDMLDEQAGDESETELQEAIDLLSDEAATDLLALFLVGRGDFGRDEWADARAQAAEQINGNLADDLLGETGLGDMLEEGLNALGYAPEALEPDA